jgi:hypothetical protein
MSAMRTLLMADRLNLLERPHPGQPTGNTFVAQQIVVEDSAPTAAIAPAVQELTTELRALLSQCLPQNPQSPASSNGNGHSDAH